MKLSYEHVTHSFSKDHPVAVKLLPESAIEVSTMDCFSNQLQRREDVFHNLNWETINPATGPIYVVGAEPGDTLKVDIHEINLASKGVVCCVEKEGVLGHLVRGEHFHIVEIKEQEANFLGKYQIPLHKMIGVIGVAPKEGSINNGTPGEHGGNMDTKMITEGTTVYLGVQVPGALLGLGDVHAAMGDGEIGVSGLETGAEVKLTVSLIKNHQRKYPMVENQKEFAVIASKDTIDEAIFCATEEMCFFLEDHMNLLREDIIMLMSMVGEVQVSQVVDPQKTARFVFPKRYLDCTDWVGNQR